jgi:hypothetical protein
MGDNNFNAQAKAKLARTGWADFFGQPSRMAA